MSDKPIYPKFDPKSTPQVREPLLNAYGFDLSDENEIGFTTGKFKFVVLGFRVTSVTDTLIATVKVMLQPHVHDEYTHVQKLNLYDGDRILGYSRTAAFQLKVSQEEIKAGMYSLRERLERFRLDEYKYGNRKTQAVLPSTKEKAQAKEILKADNVMDSLEGLLAEAGLITEKQNGLLLFLILLSRNTEFPLHALLQGSPQLCRLLMDTVVGTLPEDQLREMTSMSAGSLYYNRNKEYWMNKVLFVKGIDKHFKGVSTIREFLENQVLHRHTTESDPVTRQLYSTDRIIPGPICLLGFSEDDSVNERFFSECFFIRVEETKQNKQELLEYQKRKYAGQSDELRQAEASRMLQVIQQLIRPMKVVVPFAQRMQLPSSVMNPLLSFRQLITLVCVVTLLHQFVIKPKKDKHGSEYLEATTEHLEIALALFKGIALTKSDMLSPSERAFFEILKKGLKSHDEIFRASEAMKHLRIKRSVFYKHLNALVSQGYIRVTGGDKHHGLEYKICDWEDFSLMQKSLDELSIFPPSFHELSTHKKDT
jgi:DNA primase